MSDPARITFLTAANVLIKNKTIAGGTYKWLVEGKNYGENESINHSFADTGCYRVYLIAKNINGCIDTAKKSLCVVEDFNFYMPNSFTPNDNGVNDNFFPKGTGWETRDYLFEIYTRWGKKVFSTKVITEGWNGINSEEESPFSTYIWRVTIRDIEGMIHYLVVPQKVFFLFF